MKAEAQAPGLLDALLRASEQRAAAARMDRVRVERAAARAKAPPDFRSALAGHESVSVIGEIKRRSPSAGPLLGGGEVVSVARALAEGGVAALSVLTEPAHFGGSLEDLSRVAAAVAVPVMRKDFILDPVQLYEARASGAAAVLLIVRILGPDRLEELSAVASELGLSSLVEVHSSAELDAGLSVKAAMVGINARDLDTLAMDPRLVEGLLPAVPADRVAVAESGLTFRADVERVAAKGADAVLVGAAISGAADPAAALRAMIGVPRRSRAGVRG